MIHNGLAPVASVIRSKLEDLNSYLTRYYEISVMLNEVLGRHDDEDIDNIQKLLNQRETIIEKYNVVKKEYDQSFDDARSHGLLEQFRGREEIIDGLGLGQLERSRIEILNSMEKIEKVNSQMLEQLFYRFRDAVRHLNEEKKLLNAYQGLPQMADGVFFDRRK